MPVRPSARARIASLALIVFTMTTVARASDATSADASASANNAHDLWLADALPRYRARAPECVACQRVLAYFDEHLMLALQDITAAEAKKKTSSFSHRYGVFESVIEEAVPSACRLSSMALNKTVRTACERLIEQHEDEVVTLYYEAGEAMRRGEDERDMGEALCGSRGAMRGACEDDVAAWRVPQLELLETEASKVKRSDFHPAEQAPESKTMYKSEPQAPAPRKGEVAKIVASDFYKRVVLQRNIDALIYFSYPTKAAEFHAAYEQTHALIAEALEDSVDLLVGQLNVELNEVPPPYAAMATTPCVLLYKANKKENPRYIPLRTAAGEYITGESAPTLADVLVMVSKHAKSKRTKQEADKALVDAPLDKLHSTRTNVEHIEL